MDYEIYDLNIVFIGDFNPVIIQPFWLVNKKLIREQEGNEAKVDIIHPDLVRFTVSDWLSLEVTKNKFVVRTTKEPYFDPLRDLAVSIFGELPETPISMLGINHVMHYKMRNQQDYVNLRERLIVIDPWKSFFDDPRLLNLEVRQDKEPGKLVTGSYRIKVQPSDLIKPNGVLLNINDHYEILSDQSGRNKVMVETLVENWEESIQNSSKFSSEFWSSMKK